MSYDDDYYEPQPPRRGYGSARPGQGGAPYRQDPYRPPAFDEHAADPWNPAVPQQGGPYATALAAGPAASGNVNHDLDLDQLDPNGRGARLTAKRRRKAAPGRKKKVLKYTALGTAVVVAAVLGIGAYVIEHLDGNIKHTSLLPTGVTQQAEIPDKFGNTAMNVLLIGTDARNSAADCKLGGDCSTGSTNGGNSDVLMVIHLSADRTNSTIMSIPRDTMTTIPNCGGNSSYYGQINSSMQYGASCTVATVHQLTGLTIDHYVEVDFSGVVTMSDALGGVPVCVTNNMYDKDSGLRLNAGTTTIEGKQALEFVRTRHGFYDGSDLGREKAQHIFLSNMIRQLRSEASFTDITNLYTIADAATKSLQVDDGLAGVTNLLSMFNTMNKVPTNRVTFVTMPWELDPSNTNRVIWNESEAKQMFANIKNDVAYSSASSAKSQSSSLKSESDSATSVATAEAAGYTVSADSTSSVITSQVHAQVLNATGVSGRASAVAQGLESGGFSSSNISTGNASTTSKTVVYYPSNRAESAAAVAGALGIPSSQVEESSNYSEVTVVIGTDWTSGTTYSSSSGSSSSASPSTTAAATAPDSSSQLNASTTGQCVQVASGDIVK
ncbi:MAG TPA: LCP family protein [Actinospica sp.]|nr:LCP family protein [Actinospica sp.]